MSHPNTSPQRKPVQPMLAAWAKRQQPQHPPKRRAPTRWSPPAARMLPAQLAECASGFHMRYMSVEGVLLDRKVARALLRGGATVYARMLPVTRRKVVLPKAAYNFCTTKPERNAAKRERRSRAQS